MNMLSSRACLTWEVPFSHPQTTMNCATQRLAGATPLLSINLNRHKMLIQYLCNSLALKALPLHHVAPMTGAVSHLQGPAVRGTLGFVHERQYGNHVLNRTLASLQEPKFQVS